MLFDFFLGIDVAKKTLDYALLDQAGNLKHQAQIPNTQKAIEQLMHQLKQLFGVLPATTLVCLEHTGIYNNHLLEVFTRPDYCVWLESGKQIRYSTGIHRAKTDSVDALNIARYAQRHHPQARLWKPASQLITSLKALTSLRSRLLLAVNTLKQPLKEAESWTCNSILEIFFKQPSERCKSKIPVERESGNSSLNVSADDCTSPRYTRRWLTGLRPESESQHGSPIRF